MSEGKIVRVANAQAFWGDSQLGPWRIVNEGPVDYLTLDYLAEVSMSIMQKQRKRDPDAGYAKDFPPMVGKIIKTCSEKNIKIIANAGGINPRACMEATKRAIEEQNVTGIKVAIVEGDDILVDLDEIVASGESLESLDTGLSIQTIRSQVSSANAYTGAQGIIDALKDGADIVITGRVSDPSLVVAPLVYEFGWSMDDYDKLASATVMGHLLECGTQVTGGNFCGWRQVKDWARIGFPVIEAFADGSFVVTKHEGTGGLVTVPTVTSQLLYELGDPENYMGPDCISDFTTIKLEQVGKDRVAVSGVSGKPPTDTYKVSIAYDKGYQVLGTLCVPGPDAIEKAEIVAAMIFERVAMHGYDIPPEDRFVELFGANVMYKGLVSQSENPHEIMLRIGARCDSKRPLQVLGMELAAASTSGPPGITGYANGRPRPKEVVSYWPALINKRFINTQFSIEEI